MFRFLLLLAQVTCLLLASSANAQTLQEDIEAVLLAELKTSGVPSLQVAVGKHGKMLFEGAVGLADVENSVPATSESRYRSASISKWFTATAALHLAERDRLQLDAPVQEYCPQFPTKPWPITTQQLLTHTSGIRHYADYESELSRATNVEERNDIERRRSRDALGKLTRYTDIVATLDNFKDDPLVFEPGTDWLYSSFGYRLLGCVVEGASGRSYRSYLEEELFTPAGMANTIPDDAWEIVPNRAGGYRLDRGEPLRRADLRDVSENLPAGGHLTTSTDLIAFAHAYNAHILVAAESVSLMTGKFSGMAVQAENYTSWRHAVPSREKYAYGIMSFPNETTLWIGHTGRQAGSSSILVLVPDEDLAIAVLTNVKGWGGYMSLVRDIYSIVRQHQSGGKF